VSEPPPGAPYPAPPQTDGDAVGALVLAVASFVVCPVVAAIVALVLARQSQRKIAASGGRLTGEGVNQAARIIAWTHIGLAAFAILVLVVLAASAGS
jgi:hypothetical protein